jgi:hypothetical protein
MPPRMKPDTKLLSELRSARTATVVCRLLARRGAGTSCALARRAVAQEEVAAAGAGRRQRRGVRGDGRGTEMYMGCPCARQAQRGQHAPPPPPRSWEVAVTLERESHSETTLR